MCPIELARIIHRGFGFPYRRRSTMRSTWRGGREVRGASLTGRRECIEDSSLIPVCVPCAVAPLQPSRVRVRPGVSSPSTVACLRPGLCRKRNAQPSASPISPDRRTRATWRRDPNGDRKQLRWKWSYLTKTCAVCCRLLSIVVAGGALCKKRPERHRAVCFAAVPVALPALPAFLVLLLGAVLLLLLLPSLAL